MNEEQQVIDFEAIERELEESPDRAPQPPQPPAPPQPDDNVVRCTMVVNRALEKFDCELDVDVVLNSRRGVVNLVKVIRRQKDASSREASNTGQE